MRNGNEISIFGDGTTKRDYTYVSDIVDGILLSLEKKVEFKIINLGNNHPVLLKDVISILERNLGSKARVRNVEKQTGDMDVTYADIAIAREVLGWKPTTDFEDGIRNFVNWYDEAYSNG